MGGEFMIGVGLVCLEGEGRRLGWNVLGFSIVLRKFLLSLWGVFKVKCFI